MERLLRGVFVLVVLAGLWFGYAAFLRAPQAGAAQIVVVPAGADAGAVGQLLVATGVLKSGFGYRFYAWMDSAADHPKPGTYALYPGTSYRAIAHELALGMPRRESQLTLIEGWTVDDETRFLSDQKGILESKTAGLIGRSVDRSSFDQSLRPDFAFLQGLPRDRSLEGYLFPDTYRVWDDQLPDGLVQKQLQTFADRFAATTVGSASAPLTSLDQVVILASIIEKEVRSPQDRKLVAGIFLRRLQEGIALDSDATLTYALGNTHARATAADLGLDSPYNTYANRGLPPGPICNPGASAIDAVLHPTPSRYRYFLTDQNGKVLYAATLAEHEANRRLAGY